MMRMYIFFFTVLTLFTGLTYLAGRLLRNTNKKIWRISALDRTGKLLPFVMVIMLVVWSAGSGFGQHTVRFAGATGSAVIMIFSLILLLTLPFSLFTNRISGWIKYFGAKQIKSEEAHAQRRLFLKSTAAVIPVLALGTSGSALAASFENVRFPKVKMKYANLPEELDGFKILHLSDLHLGYYFNLDDLENTLIRAEALKPDMILVTGDVADDLTQLGGAMNLIDQLKTPFSKFVSLGNHEYHRGIREVKKILDAGPVPLLQNDSALLEVGNSKLYIGGADDPVMLRSEMTEFLDKTVQAAMYKAPAEAFKVLMSHRPRALDVADAHSVDLVLSGHTHGGQVGFNGRSAFESFAKESYLWGKYQQGRTQLYTSAGMGQWFPFRLGCPAEAPLIILKKA
ncbi:MAG: metallophosphoesterase [Calditrichaceae bacterium]